MDKGREPARLIQRTERNQICPDYEGRKLVGRCENFKGKLQTDDGQL